MAKQILLTVKRGDGSIYAAEMLDTVADCDQWLAIEKTRSSWKADFVVTIDPSAELPSGQAKSDAINILKAIKKGDIKTPSDAEAAILKLIQLLV